MHGRDVGGWEGGREYLKSRLIQTDASDSADTVKWEQRVLLHEIIQIKVREVGRGGKKRKHG
jgi:hypothetical protein